MNSPGRSRLLGFILIVGVAGFGAVGCQSGSLFKPRKEQVPPHVPNSARNQSFDPLNVTNPPCTCETGAGTERMSYRPESNFGSDRATDRVIEEQVVHGQSQSMVRGASGEVGPAVAQKDPFAPKDPNKDPFAPKDPNKKDPFDPKQEDPNGEHPRYKGINCPVPPPPPPEIVARLPTELQKVTLPAYVIEPPDILYLDAVRLVPKPPYRLQPLDSLVIGATETFPDQPIAGTYIIAPEGTIALGFGYGTLRVVGMTVDEVAKGLQEHLNKILKNPQVSVSLGQIRAVQQTRGEHLVHPDGTVHLGVYGCVNVTGMTLAQAKCAIERHLEQFLQDPEITVDVLAYNSKSFYVITDGAGFGQPLYKFPITGNDTVLDALERIGGLPQNSYRGRVWVARPSPCGHGCNQILPVDWQAIVQGGSTCTNYQLFPGDRVYVKADPLIRLDNALAKLFAPIERILGITLLFQSVINSFSNGGGGGNNGGVGFFTTF